VTNITSEVGQTTRSFFDALKEQPLSLALVVMNVLLIAYMFYSNAQIMNQRQDALNQIVAWQKDTDRLMASCVSQDVTKMMLDNMQRITETMIVAAQKDVARMQEAIEKERETVRKLIEGLLPKPSPPTSFTQPKPIDYQECDPLGPFCMPL
jgi:hypothetical protein